ncbi:hypothetical protein Vadar_030018 [Vaccinium darrowii]|uniref:Uncharacterized protein n=1 Tax=Vaccinium darrowii TaxID=229202 RepID=A0ACB7ZMI2_9ERIC|nr:hypothetical protein Vadar_030018 [Vaccinium darrowii]
MVVAREKGKRAQLSLEWASPEEDKVALKSEKRQPELSSSDWASGLPEGILDSILDRVIQLSDYLRFAAICKPWFSAAAHQKDRRRREPHKEQLEETTLQRYAEKANVEMDCFSRILSLDVSQPEIKELAPRTSVRLEKSYIVESSSGADLLLIASRMQAMVLCCRSSQGPPWQTPREPHKQVVPFLLIPSPNQSLEAREAEDDRRSLYTVAQKKGRSVRLTLWGFNGFDDPICHQGKFNVLDDSSRVLFLDVSKSNSQVKELAPRSSSGNSRGNNQQSIEKVKITSLGGDTLFSGDNYSLCVLASQFPGWQANCIYIATCLLAAIVEWKPGIKTQPFQLPDFGAAAGRSIKCTRLPARVGSREGKMRATLPPFLARVFPWLQPAPTGTRNANGKPYVYAKQLFDVMQENFVIFILWYGKVSGFSSFKYNTRPYKNFCPQLGLECLNL